ncbi:MAG: hypothetical protein KF708_20600 [Pirellulales bacterium]|nr:hypothetical protein [Pirellulales bacterium]
MRACRLLTIVAAALLLSCWPGLAAAQNAETPPARSAPATSGGSPDAAKPVVEAEPSVFWLPDKSGELQPVINFPLEEFETLRNVERGLNAAARPPDYHLSYTAKGVVRERTVELEVAFTIGVSVDHWVRIPLRMAEGIKTGPEVYAGEGESFLVLDSGADGHVLWLRGKPGEHRVTLTVVVPLSSVGRDARLKLGLPRVPTSRIELVVPAAGAVGQLAEGLVAERDISAPEETRFALVGLGSEVDFAWRAGEAGMPEAPVVLSASGTLVTQIDGRSASTDVRLKIKSREGEFDRFRIRLPAGAELVLGQQPGYSLVPVTDAATTPGSKTDRRVIEVRLDKRATEASLQLVIEQSHSSVGPNEYIDLGGVEVLGAVPQTGHIAVSVVGDWQVVWGDRRNVRQVATLPAPLEVESLAGAFEYLNQPCSLLARVVPRTSRVAVDPQFVFFVDRDEIRMQATLRYTVRGAKVFGLELALADEGWQIDEIGPANLVDLFGVAFDKLDPLNIPLLQPITGEVELTLRAHRALDEGTKQIALTLPRPIVNSVGPATVVIVPADNVDLVPRLEEIAGLAQPGNPPRLELPPRERDPFYYRGDVQKALFAADFDVHSRRVTAELAANVEVDKEATQVDELLVYRIAHESLTQLTVEVPESLLAGEGPQFLLAGTPLEWSRLESTTPPPAANGPRVARLRLLLPTPRIGACEIGVRYLASSERLPPETSVVREIPLIVPVDCDEVQGSLTLRARPGIELSTRDEVWQPVADDGNLRASGIHLAAAPPAPRLTVTANLEDPLALSGTWVNRAWVQSWFGVAERRDRAVYRLTSHRPQWSLTLPRGIIAESLRVRLDGQTIPPAVTNGVLTVPLGVEAADRGRIVELQYQFANRPPRGALLLDAPRFDSNTLVERTLWQIVLPAEEHLLYADTNLSRAFDWSWQGYYWARQPWWGQAELEAWSGAARAGDIPRSENQYVFSSLGPASTCTVWTSHRATFVLLASGCALVGGLLLLYVPALRQRGVLLAAAIAAASAALLFPDYTMLMTQAASAGVVLALVAGLLETFAARRRIRPAATGSASTSERRSTHSGGSRRPPQVGSLDSTETAPVALEAASPDSVP